MFSRRGQQAGGGGFGENQSFGGNNDGGNFGGNNGGNFEKNQGMNR
jgi:hypothetical protein